jgi:hypothetical protein
MKQLREENQEQAAKRDTDRLRRQMVPKAAAPANAPAAMGGMALESSAAGLANDGVGAYTPMDVTKSVQAAAAADKLGELFQYTVPKVTLPRQRSAMLPIVTDAVDVERVSIYNPTALPTHPLNGALITNTSGKHLLQGPMTVLDGGGYAGDATIDNLPPNDHRLISYAIDIPVKVDATSQNDERRIVSGKLVEGVLQLSVRLLATRAYQFENGAADDRTIVIEHAFRQGWKLVDTPEPFEKTPVLYRWKLAVAAGKAAKQVVKEEIVTQEALAVTNLDAGSIEFYLRDGAIPQGVKDALAKAGAMRREQADLQHQIEARQNELNQIAQDQNRLRENMRTVDQRTDYYQRLLKKLNDQETQVEAKQGELEKLRSQLEAKTRELNDYLAHLTVQ